MIAESDAVAWCRRLPRCKRGHQAIGEPPGVEHVNPRTGEVVNVLRFVRCTWCPDGGEPGAYDWGEPCQ